MSIITISRQTSSFGDEIANGLASKLGWELLTRESVLNKFFSEIVSEIEMRMLNESVKYFLKPMDEGKTYLEHMRQQLHIYAKDNNAIMVGFGSRTIFEDAQAAIHLRIIAPNVENKDAIMGYYLFWSSINI